MSNPEGTLTQHELTAPQPTKTPCSELCQNTKCCLNSGCRESYASYSTYIKGRSASKEVCKVLDLVCSIVACIEDGSISYGPMYNATHGAGQATVARAQLFAQDGIVTNEIKGGAITNPCFQRRRYHDRLRRRQVQWTGSPHGRRRDRPPRPD